MKLKDQIIQSIDNKVNKYMEMVNTMYENPEIGMKNLKQWNYFHHI